jgi:heme O synthase-like polyprenyltransferase
MAIAWLYRDDYGKAGFPLLPVIEPDGRRGRQAVAYAAALVPASHSGICGAQRVGLQSWRSCWARLCCGWPFGSR